MSDLLEDDWRAKGVVKEAWGSWLSDNWTWDWWATLTFDQVTQAKGGRFVPGSANHTLVGWQRSSDCWDHWLSQITDGRELAGLPTPYWFRGREPNPNHRGTHFHALIGGVADLSRRDAWREWFESNGICRIEPYDVRRGAGWYVAKYVVKQLGDLTFSPNAGRHMRDGSNGEREREREQAGRVDRWHVPGD